MEFDGLEEGSTEMDAVELGLGHWWEEESRTSKHRGVKNLRVRSDIVVVQEYRLVCQKREPCIILVPLFTLESINILRFFGGGLDLKALSCCKLLLQKQIC